MLTENFATVQFLLSGPSGPGEYVVVIHTLYEGTTRHETRTLGSLLVRYATHAADSLWNSFALIVYGVQAPAEGCPRPPAVVWLVVHHALVVHQQ